MINDLRSFTGHLQKVVAEEDLIEQMKVTYGVPRYVTRKLVMLHGLTPALYKELRTAGYPVREEKS